ncbi:hypothetical protein ABBQ38_013981 [Trebouxia sp. C0009 RCD-2024]
MQPLFKPLFVRVFCATALFSFFADGIASFEAQRNLLDSSRPSRRPTTSVDYSQDFDPLAALETLKPIDYILQSCNTTSKAGSKTYYGDSDRCSAATTVSSSDTDGDRCSLLKDEKTLALAESLQVLQCLQPCLAQVFPILYAEAQRLLLQHRGELGGAVKLADSACSQLAAAGACVSKVLHSLTVILRALCLHHAAAFVSHVSQACAESGYMLADSYAEVPPVPPVNTPSNCPTEANILFCSQEQSGGPRCPDNACDMLCALTGASNLSVTGYRAYSSSNSAGKVSAGNSIAISVSALGVVLVLLILFVGWKMRQYWLCSCCLPKTPDVEANDLLNEAQAAHFSQGNVPGIPYMPGWGPGHSHRLKFAFALCHRWQQAAGSVRLRGA